LLGNCGVTFFATPALARKLKGRFPSNLNGARFLSPTDSTIIRRSLDQWFAANQIQPLIVAEFHDSALMKVFGRAGAGVFAGPSIIAKEICHAKPTITPQTKVTRRATINHLRRLNTC